MGNRKHGSTRSRPSPMWIFKHVVATDIDFQVNTPAVLYFEILADQSTSNDDGSESSRALITKVHDHYFHTAERNALLIIRRKNHI